MYKLYTLGYIGSSPGDVAGYVGVLGARLVDIRFRAWSANPVWCQPALRKLLGADYEYLPALGNPNYKGGTMRLADPVRGAARLETILAERPAILPCACRDWRTCHRRLAAEFLAERLGVVVEHLPGDIARWSEEEA